ncbi:MAG: metal ABC transporter substrate-binding protein [Nitrospirota bacterium]
MAFVFAFADSSHASDKKLKIVASIAPLADFARQVGGDRVDVILLLPPGASPHIYEPTPKTIQQIAKAKVFIKIGAGLEFWADKLIRTAAGNISVVECSEGIELIKAHGHNHNNIRGRNVDPHIWLDPVICMEIVRKIEHALSEADPANAGIYKKNAYIYMQKLTDLDREIAEKVRTFRSKEYVTFHPAWNYFSRRYGLRVVGVIEEGPGKEPTPKHMNRILKELRQLDKKIIFAEPQFSPKLAEVIAREAGARVLFLDPLGGRENRASYIDLMRYNLDVMEKAMR